MNFEMLSDLRDAVKDCLDASCEYKQFVSLGRPPAECNSIAYWYSSSSRDESDNPDCATSVLDTGITVTITRCCDSSDSDVKFDPQQEEKEASCFLADLAALVACLSCNGKTLLADHIISCGTLIENINYDLEKLGGCYSTDINLSITHDICCEN